jgi:hypothetical protein
VDSEDDEPPLLQIPHFSRRRVGGYTNYLLLTVLHEVVRFIRTEFRGTHISSHENPSVADDVKALG